METQEKDWYYLLPDGRTAQNKKQVCEMMAKPDGKPLSSGYFRLQVKSGVIKKLNSITHNAYSRGDAEESSNTKPTNR